MTCTDEALSRSARADESPKPSMEGGSEARLPNSVEELETGGGASIASGAKRSPNRSAVAGATC